MWLEYDDVQDCDCPLDDSDYFACDEFEDDDTGICMYCGHSWRCHEPWE